MFWFFGFAVKKINRNCFSSAIEAYCETPALDIRSQSSFVKTVTSSKSRLLSLVDAGITNLGSKVLTNFIKAGSELMKDIIKYIHLQPVLFFLSPSALFHLISLIQSVQAHCV